MVGAGTENYQRRGCLEAVRLSPRISIGVDSEPQRADRHRRLRGTRSRNARLPDTGAFHPHRWRDAQLRRRRPDHAACTAGRWRDGDQSERGHGSGYAARNFANATATMTPQAVTSVEFYNPALDHYFISALAPDIDALDTGRFAGWQRTGLSFRVFPSQTAGGAGVTPVCRIIIPPPHGDSHFSGDRRRNAGRRWPSSRS